MQPLIYLHVSTEHVDKLPKCNTLQYFQTLRKRKFAIHIENPVYGLAKKYEKCYNLSLALNFETGK